MSRTQIMIGVILILFLSVNFALRSVEGETLKVAVFSDPHLLSYSLNPFGEAFDAYMAGDRKLLNISPQLLEKIVDEILQTDVEIVIIPGDLTKDGELVSHLEVAAQLKRLSDDGRKVYVIPGNHDINNPHAVRYEGASISQVDTVSPSDFERIYHDCGYASTISKDPHSLSYIAEPTDWLRLIAMDSCIYENNMMIGYPITGGRFGEETLNWIIDAIEEGCEKGQLVLGFMHHGIVQHFSLQETYFGDYLLDNWKEVAENFANAGMNMVFTGHFHTQDVSMHLSLLGNIIYDVQTGSLITFPNPYRIVQINPTGEIDIRSCFIEDLDDYADFRAYSQGFVKDGINGLLPGLLKDQLVNYGFSKGVIASLDRFLNAMYGELTLSQHIATVMTDFYSGDEIPSEETSQVIKTLKQNLLNPFLFLAGLTIDSLSKDSPPPDNNLSLILP